MPATQVEFYNRDKSLYWVVDLRHGKKGIRNCHEADKTVRCMTPRCAYATHFVILSNIDLSSRMKVGRVIFERSAPGRS